MKLVRGWHFPDNDGLLSKQVNGDYPESQYQQEALIKSLEQIRQVTDFNMAVDVGANIGLHSVRFAKLFKNVIAFEPSSTNFECLQQNIKNYPNVKTFKTALGESNDKLNLCLPKDSNNCGAFSFKDFVNSDQDLLKENVSVVDLDSFLLAPDFIKIDTQGFELEVIKGAVKTIEKHRPVILAEVDRVQTQLVANVLAPYNYRLTWFGSKDKLFSPVA